MSNIATISHVELVNFFSCAKPISPCSYSVMVSAGKKSSLVLNNNSQVKNLRG